MVSTEVAFRGSAADKALADKLFQVMSGFARFSSYDAPIRLSTAALSEFMGTIDMEATPEKLQSLAKSNSTVFAIEIGDEETFIVTTRAGRSPVAPSTDSDHTFAVRFMTPLPKPERTAPLRPRVLAPEPNWIRDVFVPAESLDLLTETAAGVHAAARVVDQAPIEAPAPELTFEGVTTSVADLLEDDVSAEPEVVIPAPRTITVPPVTVQPTIVPPAAVTPIPVASEPIPSVPVPSVPVQSFGGVDDLRLATAIGDRLRMDPRVANFGDDWMLEERVPRLGRNDLRRLREYLQEQEQPLTDEMLAQDVLGGRPGTPDFEQLRFAVNFRLSREHREFDFVGTRNQRFWSTGSLPQIGTTRKKPTEIATDYRVIAEDPSQQAEPRSVASTDHVLTFYEYTLGLLPYDRELQGLLPAPLMPNQRSSVLTFECPQSYTTYLVELRYPTPNRGGFILGLDDFYNENLVPGALLSIERTENDGHYLVRYIQEKPTSARMLELEDRRQRYVFRPTTYACGVFDDYLLTEDRYGNLAQEKPLDEKTRRRPESVVSASFERIGRKLEAGTGFAATFNELFAVTNIERPFAEGYLRNLLDSDESGAFAKDPDTDDGYTYVPGSTS